MIDQALKEVADKTMTLNQASVQYGVPKTTLYDRLKTASNRLGRPTELTVEEESILVERLIYLGNFGYPLGTTDLRKLIKDYLDRLGRASRQLSI